MQLFSYEIVYFHLLCIKKSKRFLLARFAILIITVHIIASDDLPYHICTHENKHTKCYKSLLNVWYILKKFSKRHVSTLMISLLCV